MLFAGLVSNSVSSPMLVKIFASQLVFVVTVQNMQRHFKELQTSACSSLIEKKKKFPYWHIRHLISQYNISVMDQLLRLISTMFFCMVQRGSALLLFFVLLFSPYVPTVDSSRYFYIPQVFKRVEPKVKDGVCSLFFMHTTQMWRC